MSADIFSINGHSVTITRKRVKNVNLRVSRDGDILVSAPKRVPLTFIREFIASKTDWIEQRKSEQKIRNEKKSALYQNGERHDFLGNSLLLRRHKSAQHLLICVNNQFELSGPADMSAPTCEKLFDEWYRIQIKKRIPLLLEKWQPIVGATANQWGVKKMRTKWGTCNIQAARIWLNLELIKHPVECLEYVVVHELTHLHERNHNARFYSLLDEYMPNWKKWDNALNTLSL